MTINILVVGLGYVGLPLMVALSKHFNTYGYDINRNRVKNLKKKIDINNETNQYELSKVNNKIEYSLKKIINNVNYYIITVPTPINNNKEPNLKLLIKATKDIAKNIKKNDTVIYESTVYPGTTEEICVPIIEKISNLKLNKDFHVGYSPERINPGDKVHKLENVIKIVSASSKKGLKNINYIYSKILNQKPYIAESIKIAEAAKVIENSQRDINIAFVNELSKIFNVLKIDTQKVLKAASTKWNFNQYYPGLVGGHCIGVDPYYLAFKSSLEGYSPKFLLEGRKINNSMPKFILSKIFKEIDFINHEIRCLVLGLTFKANINDIRNSKSIDLCNLLKKRNIAFEIIDPHLSISDKVKLSKTFKFINKINYKKYNLVIISVAHNKFKKIKFKNFNQDAIIFQINDFIKEKLKNRVITL